MMVKRNKVCKWRRGVVIRKELAKSEKRKGTEVIGDLR